MDRDQGEERVCFVTIDQVGRNYTLGHIHFVNSVAHVFRRFPRQL